MNINPLSEPHFKVEETEYLIEVNGREVGIQTRYIINRVDAAAFLILDPLFEGIHQVCIESKLASKINITKGSFTLLEIPKEQKFTIQANTIIDSNGDVNEVLRSITESSVVKNYRVALTIFNNNETPILPFGRLLKNRSVKYNIEGKETDANYMEWIGQTPQKSDFYLSPYISKLVAKLIHVPETLCLSSQDFLTVHKKIKKGEISQEEAFNFFEGCLNSYQLSNEVKMALLQLPPDSKDYRVQLAHLLKAPLTKLYLSLDSKKDWELQNVISEYLIFSRENWAQVVNVQYFTTTNAKDRTHALKILASKESKYLKRVRHYLNPSLKPVKAIVRKVISHKK